MQPEPFISVVIPTFNRVRFIRGCINSILAQTFKDFEVIIVDDGSSDDTFNVVMQMQLQDSRIYYYYKENEERSIARNFGIDKARGKYISFLDSDDFIYPNHFDTAYKLLVRKQFPEVGHLGFEIVELSGKRILTRNNLDSSIREKLISDNLLHGNAIFIRSEVAKRIKFIDSPYAILAEDWYVWLRLAARYPIHFDNTVTSAVVQHQSRSLQSIDPDRLIKSTEILIAHLKEDDIFMNIYKERTNYHFANHYTFIALTLAQTQQRRIDTLRYLIKAFQYDYSVVFRRRFLASLKNMFS